MKKFIILTILVAVLALSVNALNVPDVTVGDADQARVHNVSTTFTVTNNNASAITGIQITSSAASKYNVRFSNVPSSIAASSSATVTVTVDIPDDHDGVDSNLEENPISVGNIQVSGTLSSNAITETSSLKVQAENMLKIDKVRVACDTKTKSLEDGEQMDNLLPDQDCTFEIEIENRFDDRNDDGEKIYDVNFDSVDVKMDSSNSYVDVDVDDEPSEIDADDKDTADGTIEIDEEADRDARIEVKVSAIDDNGAKHGEVLKFDMEVTRLRHDIQVRQVSINPQSIDNCENSEVRVSVNVRNMGKRDEDQASVEVRVPDLKFVMKEPDFELDQDDSTTVSVSIPIPEDADAKTYDVEVRTYYDSLAESNLGKGTFTITACELPEAKEPVTVVQPEKKQIVVVQSNKTTATSVDNTQDTDVKGTAAKTAPTRSSISSPAYTALLISLNVLLLAAIVVVVIMFARKKK